MYGFDPGLWAMAMQRQGPQRPMWSGHPGGPGPSEATGSGEMHALGPGTGNEGLGSWIRDPMAGMMFAQQLMGAGQQPQQQAPAQGMIPPPMDMSKMAPYQGMGMAQAMPMGAPTIPGLNNWLGPWIGPSMGGIRG